MILKPVTNNIIDVFWGNDDFLPWEWTRIKIIPKTSEFYRINGMALPAIAKLFITEELRKKL